MMEQKKSIFQRAAEWGFPFGLYLSCAAVTTIFFDWFPPLVFLFILLFLGTPLVTYYFQRRKFIEDDGFTEFSALWMLGILLFILGGILSGVVVVLVAQFIRPEYLYDQAVMVIEAYQKVPEMADSEMVRVLQRMVEERIMPTPVETVFNTLWFISSGGSLLSALTALAARRPLKKYRKS